MLDAYISVNNEIIKKFDKGRKTFLFLFINLD